MADKIRWNVLACAVLLAGATLACLGTATPLPSTPVPPGHLRDLPVWARVECPDEDHLRGTANLWEHANWGPTDTSDTIGDRGAQVGNVQSCESVEVLDYEWSSFKEEFWVLVDNHSGQRGWLAIGYVEFEP